MSNSSLQNTVLDYKLAIQDLERNNTNQAVLAVLVARDKVQDALASAEEELDITSIDHCVLLILDLDKQLKDIASKEQWPYKVDAWRNSLGKSEANWWWRSGSLQVHQQSRQDVFFNISSLVLLIFTVGQVINTSSRLLALNLTWLGSSAIVLQSFFVYLASKTTLTSSSQWFDHLFASFHRPVREKSRAKFGLVAMAFGTSFLIQAACLTFSQKFSEKGAEDYLKENYISAESKLTNAIKLNPANAEAINWLGELYESRSEVEPKLAQKSYDQYSLAMNLGSISSLNNLARVAIIQGITTKDASKKLQYYNQADSLLVRLSKEEYIRNAEQIDLEQGKNGAEQIDFEQGKNLHDYHVNRGWQVLEAYKLNPAEINLEERMGNFDKAISIRERLEESDSENNGMTLETFTRHANAYCLRAEEATLFVEQMKKENPNEPDIAEESKAITNDLEKCRSQLEEKKVKRSYEIEWLKRACDRISKSI